MKLSQKRAIIDKWLELDHLEEICVKHDWKWELSRTRNSPAVICIITEFDCDGDENELSNERGCDASEAICKAIVEALTTNDARTSWL